MLDVHSESIPAAGCAPSAAGNVLILFRLFLFEDLLPRPARGCRPGFIFIAGPPFEQGKKFPLAAVASGDHGVAAQPGPFGAPYRRSGKSRAKFFLADLRQPVERGIYQFGPGSEFRGGGCRSFPVPGADILADVAAEQVAPHTGSHLFGNFAALLDREIGNAQVGIELVGRDQRVGGAGLDAARAGATAVGRRQVRYEFERSQNHAQEKPRTFFWLMMQVFFPIQPTPAYFAKTRSTMGPVST